VSSRTERVEMKPTDIKWAYTHQIATGISPTDLFQRCALLFTGEVMRSDEFAVLAYKSHPLTLCRIYEVNFERRDTQVETIESPNFNWQFLFDDLRAKQGLVVAGFEILCYRGKNLTKALTPQASFKSYSDAKKQASRLLTAMFCLHTSAELNLCTIAQVTEKTADKYFEGVNKGKRSATHEPMSAARLREFLQAVDDWQLRYTDEMGVDLYKSTKRFPLVPSPSTIEVTRIDDFR
jgi:hypothetical protein